MGGILKMEFHVKTASWEDLIWTEQHHGGISLGQNSIMGDLIGTEQPHGGDVIGSRTPSWEGLIGSRTAS